MRLVFIGPTYPHRGGIARYGTHLLGAMKKRHQCLGIGFRKLYPAWFFPGKGQLELGEMPPDGARGEAQLHYGRPGDWWRTARVIDEFAPSAVVITWWVSFWAPHMGWLARKIAGKCPVYFLCHNVSPHEARFYDPALTKWALKPGNGFIVHSEEDRNQLLKWFPGNRVIRREHPVYFSDSTFAVSNEEARDRLGITGRMLLFFGFIRPYKGLDTAIEALAALSPEFNDLTLWIAGEFWENKDRYLSLINKYNLNDRVKIESGYMSDEELALRISAADGVILPYKSATGSGVLANAYALDKPVIATRCGCFKEMVKHGSSGILCEPGDINGLANAILEFYSGEGPGRFSAGIANVKQQFTWNAIVDAVEELIEGE